MNPPVSRCVTPCRRTGRADLIQGDMASLTGTLNPLFALCSESELSTAPMGGQTAFHYTAGSCWTLLFAVVVWATTNVLECIKTITGRGFPSFGSQSAGKPKPAWMHIHYASHLRLSGEKGELRQISCYTMHIVTRTASHVGSAACSGLSAAYSYVPSRPDTRGVILRFLTLWYHQPFYLSLSFVSCVASYMTGGHSSVHKTPRDGRGGTYSAYGYGLTKFSASDAGRLSFFSAGRISGPSIIVKHRPGNDAQTPGVITYLIAILLVPMLVVPSFVACVLCMTLAAVAAIFAAVADLSCLIWRMPILPSTWGVAVSAGIRNCAGGTTLRRHTKSTQIVPYSSRSPAVVPLRILLVYAMLEAAEGMEEGIPICINHCYFLYLGK